MSSLFRIETIAQVHDWLKLGEPDHPLISIFQHNEEMQDDFKDINFVTELYMVSYKKISAARLTTAVSLMIFSKAP